MMIPIVPCPVVVGRAAEIESVASALDDACAGHGGLVFVVGEAGIGKSRLVHEALAIANDRDVVRLRGRAVPGASGSAYRPLTEALGAIVPDTVLPPDLAPWLPALASVLPTLGVAVPDMKPEVPVLGEAVVRVLRSVCAPRGGLLVLEDLHWADPDTVAIVEHLSDHLERAPVLCLATVRSDEESPALALVQRVAARRTTPVLELGRLNDAHVAAMVHSCTGGGDANTVDRVARLADGVPFLVEEMLASPGLPSSFVDTVQARLAELRESDRRLLVTAAAFGRDFDWRLLSAAAGLAESDVVDGLEWSVVAKLLAVEGDGFRFRHALTAEAVYESVIPPRRQAVASAALAALEAVHPEPGGELRGVVARLAERAGEPRRAGQVRLAAGEDALERGALYTAVVALERAADLLPLEGDRDVALERLIDALTLSGRVDDALEVGQSVVERLPASRAARVHLRLGSAALTASRWDVGAAQLAAAERLIQRSAAPSLQAELALRQGELALGTDDRTLAEERAEAALRLARRDGLPDVECGALQLAGRCARRSSLEDAEAWFRQALAAADANGLTLWRLRALHEIGTIALLDRSVVTTLKEAQALAESVGAMGTAAILDVELGAGYGGAHALAAQRRHGLEAVRRGSELGLDLVVAHGWEHVAVAAALRRDHEELERAAAAARAAAPRDRDIDGLLVAGCEMLLPLLADDTSRALAAAERGAALLRGSGTAPPAHYRAVWPLLLAVQGRPEAPAAVAELEHAGLTVNRACAGYLTMARAVIAGRSDPEHAADLAVQADDDLAKAPLYRCIARHHAAEAALADGWRIPEAWLTEAEEWLRAHGYRVLADACLDLAHRATSAIPPAWTRLGVTPREADVLTLLIEGCANREIADRLHLSVRTVEKHVESLLRKTRTQNRTQLAHATSTT